MQTRLLALETVALGGLPEIGGLASSTKGSVYDVTGDESGDPVQALLGFTVSYSSANSTPSCGPAFAVIGPSGPTASRPAFPNRGDRYIDTSISSGTLLVYDGAAWRDASGTSH